MNKKRTIARKLNTAVSDAYNAIKTNLLPWVSVKRKFYITRCLLPLSMLLCSIELLRTNRQGRKGTRTHSYLPKSPKEPLPPFRDLANGTCHHVFFDVSRENHASSQWDQDVETFFHRWETTWNKKKPAVEKNKDERIIINRERDGELPPTTHSKGGYWVESSPHSST